jgi:hypothetical protein
LATSAGNAAPSKRKEKLQVRGDPLALDRRGLFGRVLRRSPGVTEIEICNGHNNSCETRVRTGHILFHSDIGVAFDRWSDLGADPLGAMDPVLQQILIA